MASPDQNTRCPYCGSREFWPARNRGLESFLGPALPYVPFRCRACLRRYAVLRPWVGKLRLYAGGVLVLAAAAVLAHSFLFNGGNGFSADDPVPSAVSAESMSAEKGYVVSGSRPAGEMEQAPQPPAHADAAGIVNGTRQEESGADAALVPEGTADAGMSGREKQSEARPGTALTHDGAGLLPQGAVAFRFYVDIPKGAAHVAQ